jgi:hypothetical protein
VDPAQQRLGLPTTVAELPPEGQRRVCRLMGGLEVVAQVALLGPGLEQGSPAPRGRGRRPRRGRERRPWLIAPGRGDQASSARGVLCRGDGVEFVVQRVDVENAVLGRDQVARSEHGPVMDPSLLGVRSLDATVVGVDEEDQP